ncbi:MAG: murG [Bacillales bacterium]|jgi:UDP-N-acetylglucosamine--N-acetylmuramyl-(pentapeptide) pyrophosphoryl-undecaprenol N-acetylglucosamine transferase|nr:murG [Bacillales bacterium]
MSKKKIVFTGGGTAGHVTPNIAIIRKLDRDEWDIHYIGSGKHIEKELIENLNVPFYAISTGKLRREFNIENVKDMFRVVKGILGALRILRKIKPKLVFSKGGFVSVPVVMAAKILGIPCYIHESDLTPGLANKIASKFATKVFTTFDETAKYFPSKKTIAIGSPIREEILNGSKVKGLQFAGLYGKKPVITVMGGSTGAKAVNEIVRESLNDLTKNFQVIHICGKGQLDEKYKNQIDYVQIEYVHDELGDILAATDFMLTRGGSNAIFEFLTLRIPMLIIPLAGGASRGDQILNAKHFEKKGFAINVSQKDLTPKKLVELMLKLKENQVTYKENMKAYTKKNALNVLIKEIDHAYKTVR